MGDIPKRSVVIGGAPATLHLPGAASEYARQFADTVFGQRMHMLFDPERPQEDADELRKRTRGRPEASLHQCPSCDRKPMSWTLFQAHALGCYIKWRSVKLDITRRTFAGASLPSATVAEGEEAK